MSEPEERLREAMERWLRDRVQVPEHRAITASFAVLALPEMAALIADAERVRRVRELANEINAITNSRWSPDLYDVAARLSRALEPPG